MFQWIFLYQYNNHFYKPLSYFFNVFLHKKKPALSGLVKFFAVG